MVAALALTLEVTLLGFAYERMEITSYIYYMIGGKKSKVLSYIKL